MTYSHDLPDILTGVELADLLYGADAVADATARRSPSDDESADRLRHYEAVTARAAKWRLVRTRDAGQGDDEGVVCEGGRIAYYRPMRVQKDGEADVMPLPAVRRTFSEGMQRALWGCVAC